MAQSKSPSAEKARVKFGHTVVNPFIVKAITLKMEHQGKIENYRHNKRLNNNCSYLKFRYKKLFPVLPAYGDMRTVGQEKRSRKSLFRRFSQVLVAFYRLFHKSKARVEHRSDLEGLFSANFMEEDRTKVSENHPHTKMEYCTAAQSRWRGAFNILSGMAKLKVDKMQVEDVQFTVGDLSFDPNYFKVDKEANALRPNAKFILSQDPSKRSSEDIQTIINDLQAAGLDCFCKYPLEIQQIIAKIAWYIVVTPKRVIVRQGVLAENFYFIIGGQVMISKLIHKKDGDIKEQTTFLQPGSSFGELDMVNHSLRRFTATSVCTVQLLIIERDEFLNHFASYSCDKHVPDHVKFLVKCKFMQLWPIEHLRHSLEHCFVYFFKRDVVVVEDSLNTDWLYIMKKGICRVIKKLKKPPRHHVKISHNRMKVIQNVNTAQIFKLPLKQRYNDGRILEGDIIVNDSVEDSGAFSKKYSIVKPLEEKTSLEKRIEDDVNHVCVQIDLLKCRDVFGLDTLVFDEYYKLPTTESVSLVSGGAEIVLLSKKFFIENATETVKWRIRKLANSFPNNDDLHLKLESQQMWNDYKKSVMSELVSGKVKSIPKRWK